MFSALGGGDVGAPSVVRGLLQAHNNHKSYIVVRLRRHNEKLFVVLWRNGTAEYRDSESALPYDATVVQRARSIAASDLTEWKLNHHGYVVTKRFFPVTEDSGI